MAGLVPAIHVLFDNLMKSAFVYMMTNKRDGILYVGVTTDLLRRASEHRSGTTGGFTKRYGLKQLVWFEQHDSVQAAIQREKTIKHWSRAWKVRTVHKMNPDWSDLYDGLM